MAKHSKAKREVLKDLMKIVIKNDSDYKFTASNMRVQDMTSIFYSIPAGDGYSGRWTFLLCDVDRRNIIGSITVGEAIDIVSSSKNIRMYNKLSRRQ